MQKLMDKRTWHQPYAMHTWGSAIAFGFSCIVFFVSYGAPAWWVHYYDRSDDLVAAVQFGLWRLCVREYCIYDMTSKYMVQEFMPEGQYPLVSPAEVMNPSLISISCIYRGTATLPSWEAWACAVSDVLQHSIHHHRPMFVLCFLHRETDLLFGIRLPASDRWEITELSIIHHFTYLPRILMMSLPVSSSRNFHHCICDCICECLSWTHQSCSIWLRILVCGGCSVHLHNQQSLYVCRCSDCESQTRGEVTDGTNGSHGLIHTLCPHQNRYFLRLSDPFFYILWPFCTQQPSFVNHMCHSCSNVSWLSLLNQSCYGIGITKFY